MKQEEIAKLFPAHIRQALLAAHFDMEQWEVLTTDN